jgi:hypothetical protein
LSDALSTVIKNEDTQMTKEGTRYQHSLTRRKTMFPTPLLPLVFTDSDIMLLRLLVIGYTSGRQPFPFGAQIYPTISNDLRASYDIYMHVFVEQFNL